MQNLHTRLLPEIQACALDARSLTILRNGDWRGDHGRTACPVCQHTRRYHPEHDHYRPDGDTVRVVMPPHETGLRVRDMPGGVFDLVCEAKGCSPGMIAHRLEHAVENGFTYLFEIDAEPITGGPSAAWLRAQAVECDPESLDSWVRWLMPEFALHDTLTGPGGAVVCRGCGGLLFILIDRAGNQSATAKWLGAPSSHAALSDAGAVCFGCNHNPFSPALLTDDLLVALRYYARTGGCAIVAVTPGGLSEFPAIRSFRALQIALVHRHNRAAGARVAARYQRTGASVRMLEGV